MNNVAISTLKPSVRDIANTPYLPDKHIFILYRQSQGRSHQILSGQVYVSVTHGNFRPRPLSSLNHTHRPPLAAPVLSEKLDFAHQWNVSKPSRCISIVDDHKLISLDRPKVAG